MKYHPFEICWQRQEHGPINEHRNTCGGRTSAVWRDALGTTDGLVTLLLEAGFQQMSQVGKKGSLAKMLKTSLEVFPESSQSNAFVYSNDFCWCPNSPNKLTVRGVFFYIFGTFWTLEFLSFSNKYITAQAPPPFVEAGMSKDFCMKRSSERSLPCQHLSQVLCANYFHLKARNAQMQEINSGRPAPIRFALYSMFRSLEKNSNL